VIHSTAFNELCSAIDSTVATVHKTFTSQHQIET